MFKKNKLQKLLAKLLKLLWGYIYISKECRDFDIDSGNIFSVNDLFFCNGCECEVRVLNRYGVGLNFILTRLCVSYLI
jgi:hypothetical protein